MYSSHVCMWVYTACGACQGMHANMESVPMESNSYAMRPLGLGDGKCSMSRCINSHNVS